MPAVDPKLTEPVRKNERAEAREAAVAAAERGDHDAAVVHWQRFIELAPDKAERVAARLTEAIGLSAGFQGRLAAMDGGSPRKRIFVMGCARSGTWMLQLMMGCFSNTYAHPREAHFGAFAELNARQHVHVVKRIASSYKDVERIPDSISLLYIVRHPFDVMSSRHADIENYVGAERWAAEAQALRTILEHRSRGLFVVRYEDLVADPDTMQRAVGRAFGLLSARPFSRFHEADSPSDHVVAGMGGIRAPESGSVARYRGDAEIAQRCREKLAGHVMLLAWFGASFGYLDVLDNSPAYSPPMQLLQRPAK